MSTHPELLWAGTVPAAMRNQHGIPVEVAVGRPLLTGGPGTIYRRMAAGGCWEEHNESARIAAAILAGQAAASVPSRIRAMRAAGLCEHGGEIVDYTIGLCSCGECPTPRPGWVAK